MLPESTLRSQNILPNFSTTICDPLRIYPTLSESTPPSQNIPLFSITICDPPRIYSSLRDYTPFFNNYNIMRPSENLPLPPRIYPLPPLSNYNIMRRCQNLPQALYPLSTNSHESQNLPLLEYPPPPFSTYICD